MILGSTMAACTHMHLAESTTTRVTRTGVWPSRFNFQWGRILMGSLGFICKLLEYKHVCSVVLCVSRVMEKLDLRRIRPPHIIVLRRIEDRQVQKISERLSRLSHIYTSAKHGTSEMKLILDCVHVVCAVIYPMKCTLKKAVLVRNCGSHAFPEK